MLFAAALLLAVSPAWPARVRAPSRAARSLPASAAASASAGASAASLGAHASAVPVTPAAAELGELFEELGKGSPQGLDWLLLDAHSGRIVSMLPEGRLESLGWIRELRQSWYKSDHPDLKPYSYVFVIEKWATKSAAESGRVAVSVGSEKGWSLRPVSESALERAAKLVAHKHRVGLDEARVMIERENAAFLAGKRSRLRAAGAEIARAGDSIRLDESGALPIEADGFPDRESYVLAQRAKKLLDADPFGLAIDGEDRRRLIVLAEARRRTEAAALGGVNRALTTARFEEMVKPGREGSLLEFVREGHFQRQGWWRDSRGEAALAEITHKSSRSPFLKALGPGSTSAVFWPNVPTPRGSEPDLGTMRVRVNYDAQGRESSRELIAIVGRSWLGRPRWQGFLFERIGDEWLPARMDRRERGPKCIQCHRSARLLDRGSFSPLPVFLHTPEALRGVGYSNETLVRRYLELFL